MSHDPKEPLPEGLVPGADYPAPAELLKNLGTGDLEEWRLADVVTVAGFHPRWEFGDSVGSDPAVSWEKRSPVPTVSVVLSQGVLAAGREATAGIAEHNEAVLSTLGEAATAEVFKTKVLLSASSSARTPRAGVYPSQRHSPLGVGSRAVDS